MEFSIASHEGGLFVLRWIHFIAGITWIGLLYYFNFVQGEFFKDVDAGVKNVALIKLVPRALEWFRKAAVLTWVSGFLLIAGTLAAGVPLASGWALQIFIGAALGTLMLYNVWFVIWPSQKVVIQSATQVMEGGKAIEGAGEKGARALCASRTNVVFSFPMLFFMGAARHLILNRDFSQVNFWCVTLTVAIILLLLEFNALKGKPGPMASIKGVIHCGVALTVIMYLVVEFTTMPH